MAKKIYEDLTRNDVYGMISDKIESREFEKQVKIIVSKVIEKLFKELFQKKSFWQNSIREGKTHIDEENGCCGLGDYTYDVPANLGGNEVMNRNFFTRQRTNRKKRKIKGTSNT